MTPYWLALVPFLAVVFLLCDAIWHAPAEVASESECECDIFDMGPRCAHCVAVCTAAGHPYTADLTNGQHHMCGVIL